MNIIGIHDMFIIYQILQSTSINNFFELCQKKIEENDKDLIVENYNNYLKRCGLIDIIDLFHQCKFKSFYLKIENIKNDIDRLLFNYLLQIALKHSIYDDKTQISTIETKQNILKLFDKEKNPIEPTISRVS
jgi:hypothetical protein